MLIVTYKVALPLKISCTGKTDIIKTESEEVRKNLERHQVDVYHGIASFIDADTVEIIGPREQRLESDYFIIASGSYPFHPKEIPFDNERVHDSDTILNIERFPQSIAVLGAGVIGCEYATIFSTMGTKVFLINRNDKILSFIDKEIVNHFCRCMEQDEIDLLSIQVLKKS